MRCKATTALLGLAVLFSAPAVAQNEPSGPVAGDEPVRSAAAGDFFMSSDADDTEVYRAGIDLDARHQGPDQYWGVRLEKTWYRPLGNKAVSDERVYLRYADKSDDWEWSGRIGTDGDTVLGAASVHNNARFRQEFFIEREIVETPRGVDEGIYYTFVGGAIDLPVNDRNSFTLVAGAQEFTGKNVRLHARANYVHVLKPEWGLSAQLRTRYFHSTEPGEYDYYSPEWYAQLLPVLQVRRYAGGWRYVAAGGIGAQRDSASDWRSSRFVAVEVASPAVSDGWSVKAGAQYSNTPLRSGVYDYLQLSVGLTRVF